MSSIKDAINRGKQLSNKGREKMAKRMLSSPASPDKLIRLFHSQCNSHEYGSPLPIAQKTRGMLNGFIKLGRNNGWEEKRFYDTIISIVENWQALKTKELTSLNGKRILLGDRPSLLEFLIGRDSILSAIHEIENQDLKPSSMDLHTVTGSEVESPTLEQLEKEESEREELMRIEYEKMMDRML